MDLIEILATELKDKHYNNIEKTRYIYRRVCEELSFNELYFFMNPEEEKEYCNHKVDARNLESKEYVCHHFGRDIFPQILNELTTAKVVPHIGMNHSFVYVDINHTRWRLDPVFGDTAKAKLNLQLNGMFLELSDYDFTEMDKSLGFVTVSRKYYTRNLVGNISDKMDYIASVISSTRCKQSFSDTAGAFEQLSYYMQVYSDDDTYVDGEIKRDIFYFQKNGNRKYVSQIRRVDDHYALIKK